MDYPFQTSLDRYQQQVATLASQQVPMEMITPSYGVSYKLIQETLDSLILMGSPQMGRVKGFNLYRYLRPTHARFSAMVNSIQNSLVDDPHVWDVVVMMYEDREGSFIYDSLELTTKGTLAEMYPTIQHTVDAYQNKTSDAITPNYWQWMACPSGQVVLDYIDENAETFFEDLVKTQTPNLRLSPKPIRKRIQWEN